MEKIKIIFSDFDGVWTDNKVSVNDCGQESVTCCKSDSIGLSRFKKLCDVKVIVISGERSNTVAERCRKLGIEAFSDVSDKVALAEELCKRESVSLEREALYVGNDINDIPLLEKCAVSVVVADAASEVFSYADITCTKKGGDGAVRELLDEVLKCKKLL